MLSFVSQICTAVTLLLALTAKTDLLDDNIISASALDTVALISQLLPLFVGAGVLIYVVRAKLSARRRGQILMKRLPGFLASRPKQRTAVVEVIAKRASTAEAVAEDVLVVAEEEAKGK